VAFSTVSTRIDISRPTEGAIAEATSDAVVPRRRNSAGDRGAIERQAPFFAHAGIAGHPDDHEGRAAPCGQWIECGSSFRDVVR
jgi:hypothetical protein